MKFRAVIILTFFPFILFAQSGGHKRKHTVKTYTIPSWAEAHKYSADAHVYFPDYYTFYDPERGGYVFWEKNNWTFTPAMPPFLTHVDLNTARIQILKGLSLDLHPESDYPRYMKLYPALPGENPYVPVPVVQ